MALSTAIPTLTEVMVIVIISNGIPSPPIKPSTAPPAIIFGIMAIVANLIERNKTMNIKKITKNTTPRVKICDLYKLCSILLKSTNIPVR